MDPRDRPVVRTPQELIEAGAASDATEDQRGSLRAALADAMVGLKKELYGKGPERAKAYINDDFVFVVLEGGLTRNEETLLSAGHEDIVRSYRLRFQEVVGNSATTAVEEIMGRPVIGYHSQIVFDPARTFEIFVLAPSGDGSA